MPDPILDGPSGPDFVRQMRQFNEYVAAPMQHRAGSTRVERRIMRMLPHATGLELIAEQHSWDMANSTDPAEVPQGRFWGAPPNIPRFVLIGLGFAGIAALIFLLRQLSWLVAPFFLAFNLVITVYPIQTFLRRHGCPRWLAVLVTALTLVAVLGLLTLAATWAVSSIVAEAPTYVQKTGELYNSIFEWLSSKGINADTLNSLSEAVNPTSYLGNVLGSAFSGVSGAVSIGAVILSSVIMMFIDVGGWSQRIAVAGSSHPRIVAAMRMFSKGIRKYWAVSTGFGVLMAGLNYLTLWFVGTPLAFVWALLTFVTTYIPSVGFFFAMVPPVLVTLLILGPQKAIILLVIYLVTTWVVQGVFQPLMTGGAVGVNATIALLSLLFWAWVFGPIGALIALPCTLLCKAMLIDADPKVRWINSLLANKAEVRGAARQS